MRKFSTIQIVVSGGVIEYTKPANEALADAEKIANIVGASEARVTTSGTTVIVTRRNGKVVNRRFANS